MQYAQLTSVVTYRPDPPQVKDVVHVNRHFTCRSYYRPCEL